MENTEYTHVALPLETFQKVFNIISSMPYNQVSQLIKEIQDSTQGITIKGNEEKGEEKPKPKKSTKKQS